MIQQAVKTAVRSVAGRMYGASPHRFRDLTGKVLILMYHRVIPGHELARVFVQPGMYVTPETFERHLRFLTARFELLSFQDLLTRWNETAWNRHARYCVVTFDDGWLDNYRYAYPLLRAYGAPATIFLPTDLIGTREWLWSDRLGYLLHQMRSCNGRKAGEAGDVDAVIEDAKLMSEEARAALLERLARASGGKIPDERCFLDWDEAREMSHHRIEFGSHTCTHAILTRLDGAALERELRRPLEVLREKRVNHVPVLSYPNGNHTSAVVSAARAAGYRAAVTTNPGFESAEPADLFRLKRVGVHDDVSRSIPLLTFHIARQGRRTTGLANA